MTSTTTTVVATAVAVRGAARQARSRRRTRRGLAWRSPVAATDFDLVLLDNDELVPPPPSVVSTLPAGKLELRGQRRDQTEVHL
jgi:hypothetical protein